MKIEKSEGYSRVQPVENVKPARPSYNEKKQDEQKREPETKDGGLDVLV